MRVFGVVGRSGSGKTTLIAALLPCFAAMGWRVNVIKHSHHDLQFEPPSKDSSRLRAVGAAEVLVASPYRYAIFHELREEAEPDLGAQLARLAPADLTLVEGYKQQAIPRLEVYRPAHGRPALYLEMPGLLAVACDAPIACPLPILDLNQPLAIAEFIRASFAGAEVLQT